MQESIIDTKLRVKHEFYGYNDSGIIPRVCFLPSTVLPALRILDKLGKFAWL